MWKNFKAKLLSGIIFERIFYLLFFLAPLLMFHKTSEIFEFNKMIFIYALSLLCLVLSLWRAVLTGTIIVQRSIMNRPILILLGWTFLTTLTSIDRHTSVFGYYGRFNGGLLSLVAFSGLFFVLISSISPKRMKSFVHNLLHTGLLSAMLTLIWALPGRFGHDLGCLLFTGQLTNSCWTAEFDPMQRIFSTLGQPNWLGAYLAIQFFIALSYLISTYFGYKPKWSVKIYFVMLLSFFIGILFTSSRSSLLALTILLGSVLLYLWRYYRAVFLSSFSLLLFSLLILLLFVKTGTSFDRYLYPNFSVPEKVSQNSGPTESFAIRKLVWEGALKLGQAHPIFGTGPETFGISYFNFRPVAHNLTSEWDFLYNKAHNEYLHLLSTTGFVGLFCYMFYIIVFAKRSLMASKRLDDADARTVFFIGVAWSSILITNFFGFSTSVISLYFFLFPALVIMLPDNQSYLSIPIRPNLFKILSFAIGIFGLTFLISYYLADLQFAKAESEFSALKYRQAEVSFRRALAYKYEPTYDDRLSQTLSQEAFIAFLSDSLSKKERENLLSQADYFNRRSIKSSPKNPLYLKSRARNYFIHFEIEKNPDYLKKAVSTLESAKKLAPTDPKLPYTIALFLSSAYQTEAAQKKEIELESLKQIDLAINLKNDYKEAYLLKAQLLIKFKRLQEARSVYERILKQIDKDDLESKEALNRL